MEKIRLGLFDLFSFILPGIIIIVCIYIILHPSSDFVNELMIESKNLGIVQTMLILILAYFIGIFMQHFSFKSFSWLSCRIWKKRLSKEKMKLSIYEEQIVRIRHESPNNYDLLERWMALRGMSYNSFFASIILFFTLFMRIIVNKYYDISVHNEIVYLTIIGVLCYLSLRRAVTFHEWALGTINATMKFLDKEK